MLLEEKGSGRLEAIVALTGLKASGKDVFSNFLETQCGFRALRISDVIRAECRQRDIDDPSVETLQDIGDELRRRSVPGRDHLAARLIGLAKSEGAVRVVVNGIRNPSEIRTFRDEANRGGFRFFLVGITAPLGVRLQRYLVRGQAGDTLTTEAFLAMDDRDRGIGQPPEGQQTDRALALVNWEDLYCNRGSLEDFMSWAGSWAERNGF